MVHMIESAAGSTDEVRRLYNAKSRYYERMLGNLERKPRMLGLERAHLQPQDRVLEVAVGPGMTLLEIARRVDPATPIHGVDLSPGMLEKARQKVTAAGLRNVALSEADARHLPFPDERFDVLYNSYMLDLIHLDDMPVVLGEFYRVLKPGGRLVLVNLSKSEPGRVTWFERLYRTLPTRLVPPLIGACRPVVMAPHVVNAGFLNVEREFVPNAIPSEVVTATKPIR